MDFFDLQGKNYIVYTDQQMGWVEIDLMLSGKARTACDTLQNWFFTYGAPEEISFDGGQSFYSQEYNMFLDNWGIKKCTSAAYYPQSNGQAELAIKMAKQILVDSTDSYNRQ